MIAGCFSHLALFLEKITPQVFSRLEQSQQLRVTYVPRHAKIIPLTRGNSLWMSHSGDQRRGTRDKNYPAGNRTGDLYSRRRTLGKNSRNGILAAAVYKHFFVTNRFFMIRRIFFTADIFSHLALLSEKIGPQVFSHLERSEQLWVRYVILAAKWRYLMKGNSLWVSHCGDQIRGAQEKNH